MLGKLILDSSFSFIDRTVNSWIPKRLSRNLCSFLDLKTVQNLIFIQIHGFHWQYHVRIQEQHTFACCSCNRKHRIFRFLLLKNDSALRLKEVPCLIITFRHLLSKMFFYLNWNSFLQKKYANACFFYEKNRIFLLLFGSEEGGGGATKPLIPVSFWYLLSILILCQYRSL